MGEEEASLSLWTSAEEEYFIFHEGEPVTVMPETLELRRRSPTLVWAEFKAGAGTSLRQDTTWAGSGEEQPTSRARELVSSRALEALMTAAGENAEPPLETRRSVPNKVTALETAQNQSLALPVDRYSRLSLYQLHFIWLFCLLPIYIALLANYLNT